MHDVASWGTFGAGFALGQLSYSFEMDLSVAAKARNRSMVSQSRRQRKLRRQSSRARVPRTSEKV